MVDLVLYEGDFGEKKAYLVMKCVHSEGSDRIYVKRDPLGESESYEAFQLVGYQKGVRSWVEGVRKDRTEMREPLKTEVEKAMREMRE